MAATFSLLPNARAPLGSDVQAPAAGGARRRASVEVQIRADGEAAPGGRTTLTVEMLGAGDVVGVDRRIIARVEPPPGVRGYEPNYLPFFEFIDADYPWRYTLDTAAGNRLRPWLVAIALRPEEFEFVELGGALLPVIRVLSPRASLPELAQSWAWAHVHVSRDVDPALPVDELVRTRPDASFSRLLCARRLADNTVYHLFLVPAYEAGRLAGLGEAPAASPWNRLAWSSASSTSLDLPVYHRSQFVTSAVEDLEVLLRRLRPLPASDAAGVAAARLARADEPGFFPDYHAPGRTITTRDALARPGTPLGPMETDPELLPRLAAALTEAVAADTTAPGDDGPAAKDPLLAPPAYGWRAAVTRDLRVDRANQGHWFDRVNLDLGLREAAGLGAETVRRNQEQLVRLCWAQHEQAVDANRRINRFRLAAVLAQRLVARRFARLPAEVALAAAEPLAPYQRAEGVTVRETLAAVGVPTTFASRDLRRQSAKRPRRGPTPAIPAPSLPSGRPPTEPSRPTPPAVPAALDQFIRQTLGAPAVLEPARQPGIAVPVGQATAAELVAPLRGTLTRLPRVKAATVVEGMTTREGSVLGPVVRHPAPPVTLAPRLTAFAPDRLLNGLGGLEENTVTLVEEYRPFVEAFLVGANHELANELRWRGFPTDGRRTLLTRFWDRGRLAGDPTGDDIPPVHQWTRPPGLNFPPHDDGQAELVLVLRSDAVRRFGQLVVVLNHAPSTTWQEGRGTDHHPVFFGRFGDDTAYYGFAVGRAAVEAARNRFFLVLYEPVGRLRFGLDVATVAVRRGRRLLDQLALPFALSSLGRTGADFLPPRFEPVPPPPPTAIPEWDDFSWSHVERTTAGYVNASTTQVTVADGPDYWGSDRTSATIARSMWQKPVAVVIPVGRLL
jgi:hypothetical protein